MNKRLCAALLVSVACVATSVNAGGDKTRGLLPKLVIGAKKRTFNNPPTPTSRMKDESTNPPTPTSREKLDGILNQNS